MRVSDLAVHILYPAGDTAALESKRIAALSPPLFKQLYDEKREGSDESIKNYLVSKLDFTPGGATQAVEAFRDTLAFAELNGSAYNASSTPESTEAKTMQPETKSPDTVSAFPQSAAFRNFGSPPPVSAPLTANVWTWTLSMPRSVRAELRILGEPTKADVGRLKKQIAALEEAFEDADEENKATQ